MQKAELKEKSCLSMGNLSTEFKFPSPKLKLPFPNTPDEYKIMDKFGNFDVAIWGNLKLKMLLLSCNLLLPWGIEPRC